MGNFRYFEKANVQAKEVYAIKFADLSKSEQVLAATLQGLAANVSATQLFMLEDNEHPDYKIWLDDLATNHGCTVNHLANIAAVLDKFLPIVNASGYVLYDKNDGSVNSAVSLCGIKKAVAVEVKLEPVIKARGFSLVDDARGISAKDIIAKYGDKISKKTVVEQIPDKTPYMIDYAVMTSSLMFFVGNTKERDSLLSYMDEDSACMGWGDASNEESVFVNSSGNNGIFTIPADWSLNLSILSGFPSTPIKQSISREELPHEEDVHYVCFMMSDGDNIQWAQGRMFADKRWWGNEHRSEFPTSWAVAPAMYDLFPTLMKRYYESSFGKSCLMVGPSGNGYMYPKTFPEKALKKHIERLNSYMGDMDLSTAVIIDFDSFECDRLWDTYLTQPNIGGLFFLEYINHKMGQGKISWYHDKPVINPREMLWDKFHDGICNKSDVAKRINKAPIDIHSENGYTLVLVHVWSDENGTMDAVNEVVGSLDKHIRVVGADDFVKLIKKNVKR